MQHKRPRIITMQVFSILLLFILFCLSNSTLLQAAELPASPSRWAFGLKMGAFYPDEDDWDKFYGKDRVFQVNASAAFMLSRYFEIGIEGGYIKDDGDGYLPANQTTGGNVTIKLYPVHAYVLLRGTFRENQMLVPYIGGGWSRIYYSQNISNQSDIDGSTDGHHFKGGLELLLDSFDPGAANSARNVYGINHSYLFFEFQKTDVSDNKTNADLGGDSYLLGVRIEF